MPLPMTRLFSIGIVILLLILLGHDNFPNEKPTPLKFGIVSATNLHYWTPAGDLYFESGSAPRCGLACSSNVNCTEIEDSFCHQCISGRCGQKRNGECFYEQQCVEEDTTCYNSTCVPGRKCGQPCETRANCISSGSKCSECIEGVCTLSTNNALFDLSLVSSFSFLCLLLALGQALRIVFPPLRWLHIPASIAGGIAGFIIVQLSYLNETTKDFVQKELLMGWSEIPGFLINFVFVGLFLGHHVPLPDVGKFIRKLRGQTSDIDDAWDSLETPSDEDSSKKTVQEFRGGAAVVQQLIYGQILAWSQYTLGMAVSLTLLRWIFGEELITDFFGATLALGFEGGAGTCSGLAHTMSKMGWEEGLDVCLTFSTIGIVAAVVVGIILVQIGRFTGQLHESKVQKVETEFPTTKSGFYKRDAQPSAGAQTVTSEALDVLSLHLCFVGLACIAAYILKRAFIVIERQSELLTKYALFSGFPLFPLAMAFGLLIQILLQLFKKDHLVNGDLMDRISGISLDFLIVAAMATISLTTVSSSALPIFLLSFIALLNHLFVFFVICRLVVPNTHYERGLCELGQSLGVSSSALLLLKLADPTNKTPVLRAFSGKQIVHETVLGGGLWTAIIIPLIGLVGPWTVLFISATCLTLALLASLIFVPGNIKHIIANRKKRAATENIHINLDGDEDAEENAILSGGGVRDSITSPSKHSAYGSDMHNDL